MYGSIVEFPSSILNDIANENHEQAMKEMQIKDAIVQNVCASPFSFPFYNESIINMIIENI
jgi:hypothetical protein